MRRRDAACGGPRRLPALAHRNRPCSANCAASGRAPFAWREPPYEYETERLPIDILAGGPELREAVEADRTVDEIAAAAGAARDGFDGIRDSFLLYR